MNNIKIDKFIPGGQSIGALPSGKKAMLWGALPGELITEYEVTKEKSTYLEAIAVKISQSSPRRVAPLDDCYLATSPWQILNYNYELESKHELLLEIFRQQKIPLDDVKIAEVQTDNRDFYYRNKMEYALYYDHADQQIHLAFRARGTHRKIIVNQSSLERPEIWQRAQAIIAEMNQRGDEARNYQSLLLRCSQDGQVSGGLTPNGRKHPVFDNLQDNILDRSYSYSPNGFFQINLPVYELALREIARHITTSKVLDLYAGVGTIGLSVARDRELTLVECDKSAYRELENNCRNTAAHPVLAKSEDALDYIQSDQTVIVDPPRAGCFSTVIEKFLAAEPPIIIYLSCNPITQARDIAALLPKYRITKVVPYNFFPRTPHLENLVILEHK